MEIPSVAFAWRKLEDYGHYYTMGCLPFPGLPIRNFDAPGEYQSQAMAHKILQDYYLNGAGEYIDDTIIYGRNEETFLTLLDQILSKLEEFNVRLKPSKCYFGMDHIEFLAHVFSESEMQLSD